MQIVLNIKLTANVARQEDGEVMTRDEIKDEIIEAIEGADPGSIGDYDVEDWTVEVEAK